MPPANPHSSDDSDVPIRIEHQYNNDTPPSIAIVQAIATIENINPMDSPNDLGVTLYDHIDPTALDRLMKGKNGDNITIDFTIQNGSRYFVRVEDTGQLVIEKSPG